MTESAGGPRGKQRWNNAGDVFGRGAADRGLTHSFMGLAVKRGPHTVAWVVVRLLSGAVSQMFVEKNV